MSKIWFRGTYDTIDDLWGNPVDVVRIDQSHGPTMQVYRDEVRKLFRAPDDAPQEALNRQLARARVDSRDAPPPLVSLLLCAWDTLYIDLAFPAEICTLLSTEDARSRIGAAFGDTANFETYGASLWRLATACAEHDAEKPLLLAGYGVLIGGDSVENIETRLASLIERSKQYLAAQGISAPNEEIPEQTIADQLRVVEQRGQSEQPNLRRAGITTPARTPQQAAYLADSANLQSRTDAIIQNLGAQATQPHHLPAISVIEAEFSGEVALVTGAASGIGKACAEEFLSRGAAVIGLDINPAVCDLFEDVGYIGVQGDVREKDAVIEAIHAGVHAFGGIDIAILNAGINEDHAPLESYDDGLWQWVMSTNLDANALILRELYPYIRHAPRGGRLILNASKSAPAPGPGSSSYTVSKAGLIQLARLAALEWGKDGIRVNVVNPNAVFDTAIWKDNMAEKRAKHYGMTLEEYQRNNLLKVRIWSKDVARVIADLCGETFAKMTGAQIPIDGGNNRVI